MPKRLAVVVGARPNFMKAAPLMEELSKHPDRLEPQLIHTGQHYDHKLSQLFFDELGMPQPDIHLGVGSGSHAVQTARIMIEIEQVFLENRPDLVIVFGDVNSTMAAAIVASKLHIPTAHVEAGPHTHRTLQAIRAAGMKAGVAVNPGTPAEAVEHLLDLADLVCVMTVNPGFGGQKFIDMTAKVRRLR